MIEQTKHTPGPWLAINDPQHPDEPSVVGPEHTDDSSQYIATCHGGLDDQERAQHANARLIAAAPDLLQGLVDLLDDKSTTYAVRVLRARAIIAKATGSTP